MANVIKIKRKTTTGAPTIGDLSDNEFCYVEPDDRLYLRKSGTELITFVPISIGTSAPTNTDYIWIDTT